MADAMYQNNSISAVRPRVDWRAIWGGVFTFIGIWSVFGSLGWAIFASAANPNAARPITGMGIGMSIWAIVLTIIAMYVAGLETGHLAQVVNRHEGLLHGMIMFGLSVVAALVIAVLGGSSVTAGSATATGTHNPYVLDILAGLGWAGFLSLFFGWLAAMGGASTGVQRRLQSPAVEPIRRVA